MLTTNTFTTRIGSAIIALSVLTVSMQANNLRQNRTATNNVSRNTPSRTAAAAPARTSRPATASPANRSFALQTRTKAANPPAGGPKSSPTSVAKPPGNTAKPPGSTTKPPAGQTLTGTGTTPVKGTGAGPSTTNVTINNSNVNNPGKGGTYTNKPAGGPRGPRGPMAGDVTRHSHIPNDHFRASFGRTHEFHIHTAALIGPAPVFFFGGVGFRLGHAWPMGWVDTDPLYIDYAGGSYFLRNRFRPDERVPVNVAECESCLQEPAQAAELADASASAPPATLARGMTAGQVVAQLGSPKDVIDLGFRQIFLYDNLRVTFHGGRLSDVR